MPDITIVFRNGTITGEHAGFCNVDQTFTTPFHRIAGVIFQRLFFSNHICVEIRKGLEPVFVDQFMMQAAQIFLMTCSQHFRTGKEVNGTTDIWVTFIPLDCLIISGCRLLCQF